MVSAAASAVHDALVLCVSSKDEEDGTSSSSRLPKDTIQNCIKPILLKLRDHTALSLPLLRGLLRLLGLLSTWFNKSLGSKLLEHLIKFEDPGMCFCTCRFLNYVTAKLSCVAHVCSCYHVLDTIIQLKAFKPGEEPLIAAALMELFALLPQASNFVESLVQHTIQLEVVLHRYKPSLSTSPFRAPLAKYLNRYYTGKYTGTCLHFTSLFAELIPSLK